MRIGIDLDDTISEIPAFFAVVTTALIGQGHQVHILTFRDPDLLEDTRAELATLGISYTAIHVPGDNRSAAEWKRSIVTEARIDLMIDDSPEVLAAMPPGVHRVWLCDPEVFDLNACIRALQ